MRELGVDEVSRLREQAWKRLEKTKKRRGENLSS